MANDERAAWQRIALRVMRDAALPMLAAIGWGTLIGMQKHSGLDGVSAGGVAFFLVLSLQGQVLRVSKQVRDEDRYDSLDQSLAAIMRKLEENGGLGVQPPAGLAPAPQLETEGLRAPEEFVRKAKQLTDGGSIYPALLTASVGFEVALQDAARRYELVLPSMGKPGYGKGNRRPIPNREIIAGLKERFGDKVHADKLWALLALRNGLVHAKPEFAEMPREDAEIALSNFAESIELLGRLPW